jgi:hypothetical protein
MFKDEATKYIKPNNVPVTLEKSSSINVYSPDSHTSEYNFKVT